MKNLARLPGMLFSHGRTSRPVEQPAPSGSSEPVVELVHVSRRFGDVQAVRDVSLRLESGEFITLLGPSGCGKTTTLRMIAGFERPTSGQVRIAGEDATELPPNKRPVNTVFQSYALFSHLNVFDNIAFGLRESRRPKREIERSVSEALGLVQLAGLEGRKPRELSGGQQQRVALARAIVNAPKVLLLDEPLGALDLKLRRAMQIELKALQRRLGITFLYVTHDQEEAFVMSDRVAVLEAGQVLQIGSPQEIYDYPSNSYVADFVGEANIMDGRVVAATDEQVTVEVAGRTVEAQRPAGEESGRVRVVIRPERVTITPLYGPADASELVGTVTESFFVGSFRKYVVAVDGLTTIGVLVLNRASAGHDLAVGSTARLSWDADDAWTIAVPDASGQGRADEER